MSKKIPDGSIVAAIDLGTNTCLMLIGRKRPDGSVEFIREEHAVARLGEDLGRTGLIGEAAQKRALTILRRYRELCAELCVGRIVAVGTSALRDAGNRAEVRRALSDELGAELQVIDGSTEARLAFLGAAVDGPCTVVDIGGGSTEVISGDRRSGIERQISLDIGAVRGTERYFSSLPPSAASVDEARRELRSELATIAWPKAGRIVAVGGTPTTLAAMVLQLDRIDVAKIDGFELQRSSLKEQLHYLLTRDLAVLRAHPVIHPARADILPMGSLILEEVMNSFKASSLQVSVRGLRYGLLLDVLGDSGDWHG